MSNKLKSIKTWIIIWSMVLITAIVMFGLEPFNNIAVILSGAIITYIPCNVAQKKILGDKNDNRQTEQQN